MWLPLLLTGAGWNASAVPKRKRYETELFPRGIARNAQGCERGRDVIERYRIEGIARTFGRYGADGILIDAQTRVCFARYDKNGNLLDDPATGTCFIPILFEHACSRELGRGSLAKGS